MFSLLKEQQPYLNHPRNLPGKLYVQARAGVFVLQEGQRYSLSLSAVEYMVWISCFNSILILFSPKDFFGYLLSHLLTWKLYFLQGSEYLLQSPVN